MPTFRVPDMTCGHCASTLAKAIAAVDKDARIEISVPQKLISIATAAAEPELVQAIQEAGYSPEKVQTAPAQQVSASRYCCGSRKAASIDASRETAAAVGSRCS